MLGRLDWERMTCPRSLCGWGYLEFESPCICQIPQPLYHIGAIKLRVSDRIKKGNAVKSDLEEYIHCISVYLSILGDYLP